MYFQLIMMMKLVIRPAQQNEPKYDLSTIFYQREIGHRNLTGMQNSA